MTRDLLCERCYNPIDRTREPMRVRTHGGVLPDGAPVRTHVHALPCARPDTGEWDRSRRGLSPAAVRHAAAQADHR
ncbi:hypothetical protein [Pseudonocardia sp. HH130630-07]|uniref:hypothetical protein n=1 Tax=Pseudonocardia sp. HH130630-07 TaxID=1690815 RepID=UPI000814C8FD|nr:hypothetical protein [Pseudonocardia sp. HH130630-07]ANY09248.1 hypothetical protein AFB00_26750 [Pseudonocardia sp. HH130630-07]